MTINHSAPGVRRLVLRAMRTPVGFSAAALVLLAAVGCVMPMSVTRSFGKGVLLDPEGSTFAWSPALGSTMRRLAVENLPNHVAILDTIADELGSKGYSLCEGGTPDYWASYDTDARDTVNPWTNKPVTELTFTVSIRQASTEQVYYAGTAFIDVDGTASPEVRMNTLRAAVQRILDHFPRHDVEDD